MRAYHNVPKRFSASKENQVSILFMRSVALTQCRDKEYGKVNVLLRELRIHGVGPNDALRSWFKRGIVPKGLFIFEKISYKILGKLSPTLIDTVSSTTTNDSTY